MRFSFPGWLRLASGLLLISSLRGQSGPDPQQPTAPPQGTPLSAGQTPTPSTQQTAPTQGKTPSAEDERLTTDGMINFEVFYWQADPHPTIQGGKQWIYVGTESELQYPGTASFTPGAVITVPAGKDNSLRLTGLRTLTSGTFTANEALTIFGQPFNPGDYTNVHSEFYNVKLSYEYLSWPYPVTDSKFRLKTLWEMQYVTIRSIISGPIIVNSDGTYSQSSAVESRWFIFPTFGLAAEYSFNKRFRVEVRGSAFGWPHRSDLYDTQAEATYRRHQFELLAGYKFFYYKTSPQSDEYLHSKVPGPYLGIRYNLQ